MLVGIPREFENHGCQVAVAPTAVAHEAAHLSVLADKGFRQDVPAKDASGTIVPPSTRVAAR